MEQHRPLKILKSPIVKRTQKQTKVTDRVQLERVLGLTASSNSSLACDPNTGTIAYPTGSVVVLLNAKRNKQTHLFNQAKKTITCLAFSADGKHLVTGESGHQPAVRVWDVEERSMVAEYHGHKFAINCVAFSPNLKHIVSVGSQHDMMVNVWNWKTQAKVASNKVASKVTQLVFSEDGSFFITVGNRHVKYWYLDTSKAHLKETVPLNGRNGILGDQKNNFFCGVCCGKGVLSNTIYAITQSGLLCQFNAKRMLDKWAELRTTSAHGISVGGNYIFIACANGIVRVFNAQTLHFITTLPKPHYLGVDIAAGQDPSHISSNHNSERYPDTIAAVYDDYSQKVTCIYNDHSMYIWDVHDLKKIGKLRSFLYHSGCIWGVDVYPILEDDSNACLPPNSFVTCSSDDTIRIWNLDSNSNSENTFRKNIYSNELLKILYTDSELSNILDIEFNRAGKTDKTDVNCLEKNGVRCVKVSPDGKCLASGTRLGNIKVHDLEFMDEECTLEAHESEVLCLEFTRPETGMRLLASAGRDRLLHLFDMNQNYGLVQTLDDHSSAITAVRFTDLDGQLNMLSCGADKSLLFRTAQFDPDFQFVLNRHLVGKTTLYDMDVDPTEKFVATACQDRNVRIYNINNGKQKKCYKGAVPDDSSGSAGTLIRLQMDPSGTYVATSCSDKNLAIYDFFSGDCVASMFGHSELVTGIQFMNDMRHMISVSGDGCIFVWKLPYDFTEQMCRRMVNMGRMVQQPLTAQEIRRGTYIPSTPKIKPSILMGVDKKWNAEEDQGTENVQMPPPKFSDLKTPKKIPDDSGGPDWRFSVGQLPGWAKKKEMDKNMPYQSHSTNAVLHEQPLGKWAQRTGSKDIVMKSVLDDSTPLAKNQSRFASEGDQDNSSHNLTSKTPLKPEAKIPITADDETNQDDEDDEFSCISLEQKIHLLDSHMPDTSPGAITLSRGSDPGRVPGTQGHDVRDPSRWGDFVRTPGGILDEGEGDNAGEVETEEEEEDSPVIYLPNETGSESSETIASTFPVFEGDTFKDMESEVLSMESDEESQPATPTTPKDPIGDYLNDISQKPSLWNDFEKLADENFQQRQFHQLTADEDDMDKLGDLKNIDNTNMYSNPARLSISSRFLSRAQHQQLRDLRMQHNRDSSSPLSAHMKAVEDKRAEMVRAIEETRNHLRTLGWQGTARDGIDAIPERDVERDNRTRPSIAPPSPPSKLPAKDYHSSRNRNGTCAEQVRKDRVQNGRTTEPLSSSRKWKSSVDLNARSMTPVQQSRTLPRSKTPTLRSRSTTPTSMLGSRSTTPTSNYVTRTEMKLESPTRRYMDSGHESSTLPRTRNDAKKASYLKQTESSMAKTSNDFGTSTLPRERRISANSAIRRGKLNSTLKAKFKSTPDLISEKEAYSVASSAKTTDDMSGASRKSSLSGDKKSRVSRKSMPATKEQKDVFGIYSHSSASSTTSSVSDTASRRSFSPTNTHGNKYGLNVKQPVSILRPTSAQGQPLSHKNNSIHPINSEFSLNDARDYLLGKSEHSDFRRPPTSRSMPEAMSDHVSPQTPNKSADNLTSLRSRMDVSPRDPPEKDHTQSGGDRSRLQINLNEPTSRTPTGRYRKHGSVEPPKQPVGEPREGEPDRFRSPSPSKSVRELRGQFESSSSDKEPTPPPRRHRKYKYDPPVQVGDEMEYHSTNYANDSRLAYSSSSAEGSPEHSMSSYKRRMATRSRSRTPTSMLTVGSPDDATTDDVFSQRMVSEGSPNYNSGITTISSTSNKTPPLSKLNHISANTSTVTNHSSEEKHSIAPVSQSDATKISASQSDPSKVSASQSGASKISDSQSRMNNNTTTSHSTTKSHSSNGNSTAAHGIDSSSQFSAKLPESSVRPVDNKTSLNVQKSTATTSSTSSAAGTCSISSTVSTSAGYMNSTYPYSSSSVTCNSVGEVKSSPHNVLLTAEVKVNGDTPTTTEQKTRSVTPTSGLKNSAANSRVTFSEISEIPASGIKSTPETPPDSDIDLCAQALEESSISLQKAIDLFKKAKTPSTDYRQLNDLYTETLQTMREMIDAEVPPLNNAQNATANSTIIDLDTQKLLQDYSSKLYELVKEKL